MDNKKLLEISCKEMIMEIVKNSDIINKTLTFEQKILLYEKINSLTLNELNDLLFTLESSRELETKDERDVKYGAATTAGGIAGFKVAKNLKLGKTKGAIAGSVIGAGAMFLFRRLTDKCFLTTAHKILTPRKRKLAMLECRLNAIEQVISQFQQDFNKCEYAPNPERCKNHLAMELKKWRKKYQEHLETISKLR